MYVQDMEYGEERQSFLGTTTVPTPNCNCSLFHTIKIQRSFSLRFMWDCLYPSIEDLQALGEGGQRAQSGLSEAEDLHFALSTLQFAAVDPTLSTYSRRRPEALERDHETIGSVTFPPSGEELGRARTLCMQEALAIGTAADKSADHT